MQATGLPHPSPPVRRVPYAPPPPVWQRRSAQVRIALLSTVTLLALGGWLWGPDLWSGITLLSAQRRCLNASAPADRVVFDDEPKRSAALLSLPASSDGKYISLGNGRPVAWVSQDFDRFYAVVNPTGRQPSPTLFLGELQTSAGIRRLVYIDASCTDNLHDPLRPCMVYLNTVVIVPGTFGSAPRERFPSSHGTAALPIEIDATYPFRFFAGQVDPQNPSRFMIPFERDGRRAMVEGRLRDDETVRLDLRFSRSLPRF
jgi:hypothetical protein